MVNAKTDVYDSVEVGWIMSELLAILPCTNVLKYFDIVPHKLDSWTKTTIRLCYDMLTK